MTDPKANNVLVETLGTSLRYGGSALSDVPDLLKRVLAEGAWREFVTRRGELVHHDRFAAFVAAPPLGGLGADMALIERIVGTADPDLLRLLRDANKGKPGRPRNDAKNSVDSTGISDGAERSDLTAQRLAIEAPDEYAAVQRGEKSIHAAAISAGIRKRRIPVRLDSPESAAETLRKHMPPETRRRLAELLTREDQPCD